jgi:hypothetical protein
MLQWVEIGLQILICVYLFFIRSQLNICNEIDIDCYKILQAILTTYLRKVEIRTYKSYRKKQTNVAIINKSGVLVSLLELWFKENEWQLNFRLNYN